MNVQLLRHATLTITAHSKVILVDPMLAPAGTYDPWPSKGGSLRNPLVDLPIDQEKLLELIKITDAVLITHAQHLDHWDATAIELLSKNAVIFCQPVDAENIRSAGFAQVTPIDKELIWNSIRISRTDGQHGVGEIGEQMGKVSGYVIDDTEERLYIAGDTIWCQEVEDALKSFTPTHVIVNGGAAQFLTGGPIVMTVEDVITVCNYAPQANIYVVHLESVNHSTETRKYTKAVIQEASLNDRCFVPNDGDWLF
ncbi:MBL fold metallo-hydrolase [Mucilaginibacter sp. cycad4]|uniref:MBL fold metallo-hydrolase n=1 Tax=Mucilaginibacter sp. cycad4 TaxID=3342096 RepID=UPI002AAB3F62|nr:MBL fold metallo-hydrolase [Mucilaginibacter gossypii]WPU99039.1 MBL fold metallo-hydrolase [Mucilaginibacter gossypii]